MEYKYNHQNSKRENKIPMSNSPKFENQLGYANSLFPQIDSMRGDTHHFLNDEIPNFGSSNVLHNHSQNQSNRLVGNNLNGEHDQQFLLSQNLNGGYPHNDAFYNHHNNNNDHNLMGISSQFHQDQLKFSQQQQHYYMTNNSTNALHQRMNQTNFNNQNHSFHPSNTMGFDNQPSMLKGQFSDFSWRSDDDEDYSLNEDLELNEKIYKKDLRPFKFQIPKTEVNDLLRDTIKNTNNYSIDSILDSGVNHYNNQNGNLKKRRLHERVTPQIQQSGIISTNTNNSILQNKRPRIQGLGNYPIVRPSSTSQQQQIHEQSQYSQQQLQQYDQMFLGQPSENQSQNPQFGSQISFRPNLQNNYYYNFNNNFVPQQNTIDNCGSQVQTLNHQTKPNVQTKSIEIQVTPEKLVEQDESYDKDQKNKKRRRRSRKQISKEKNLDNKNNGSNSKDNKQSEYLQYYDQYVAQYGQAQPYNLAGQGRFSYVPPFYPQYPYLMHGPQQYYYQNFQHQMNPFQSSFHQNQSNSSSANPQNLIPNDDQKYKEQFRDYVRTMFYPFQNDQLREVILQIDMYIQILYQMLLLGKKKQNTLSGSELSTNKDSLANDKLCYKIYSLLYDFQSKKEQTLKPLNLPTYQIPFITNSKGEPIQMNPQVSYFQSPLLEIAPDIMQQLQKPNQDSKAQMKFLNSFTPLINQYLLPSIYNFLPKGCLPHHNYSNHPFFKQLQDQSGNQEDSQNNQLTLKQTEFQLDGQPIPAPGPNQNHNNRRKFSYVDDNFLLLGLRQYGYKEVDSIRDNWLPNKTTNEIKHRYKNLTCAKAPDNIIKRWKVTHNIPLTEQEEKQLAKAIKWFGCSNRWALISKCFLPNRSPHFLKMEYQNIVSDHSRAERFGQLMLSDDEDDEQNFEDIDLDQIDKQKRKHRKSISQSSSMMQMLDEEYDENDDNENFDYDDEIQMEDEEEEYEYEEELLEQDQNVNMVNDGDENILGNDSDMKKQKQKLSHNFLDNEEEKQQISNKEKRNNSLQLNNLQSLLANFMGNKNTSKNNNLKSLLSSLQQQKNSNKQISTNKTMQSQNKINQIKIEEYNLQQQNKKGIDEISLYEECDLYQNDDKINSNYSDIFQSIFELTTAINYNPNEKIVNDNDSNIQQYDIVDL